MANYYPLIAQTATEVPEIYVPERKMKQDRR